MPSKDAPLRIIDQPGASKASSDAIASEAVTTLPRLDLISAPTGLTVSGQNVYRSSASPMVAVNLTWTPPFSTPFDSFIVQFAQVNTFVGAETVTSFDNVETIIVKPSTTYYARVAAQQGQLMSQWSDTLTINTISDSTIPSAPGSMTLEWSKGDLLISVPITNSESVKNVRIRIYNAAQTVLIKEVDTAAPFLFTADENIRLTGGTTSLSIVAHYRSWSDVLSATGLTQATSSTAPGSLSGVTSNWNGDTGTAAADLIVSWNVDSQSSMYVVEFNNNASLRYTTVDNEFNYTWETNARNNAPSGLYTMPVRVWGVNKLTQSGAVSSFTHTNAAPTTTGATLTAFAGFSQIIGQLTTAQINDVLQYQYTLIPSVGSPVVYSSNSKEVTLPVPSAGLWTLRANIIDRFGRASSNIDSSQFYSDSITISGLRSSATYDDSQSTNPATLNGLKDNILSVNVVTHNNTTAGSRWTRMNRDLVDRYRSTTITTSGAMRFFLEYTADGSSFRYFAGPLTGTYGNTLTEYASLATAQTNYVTHSGQITRYDLPAMVEARNIRMYHWTGTGSYGLQEYYPRRLVQSDDIEAETIKSINIAASAVTADKIFVLNLSAVNAATGNLTVSGVLSIAPGTGSGLYQGTGTFASPTTGLKIWRDSNGIGRFTTYSGGIAQIDIGSDGKLTAGTVGGVRLSENGFEALGSSTKYFKTSFNTTPYGRIAFLDDEVTNTFRYEWYTSGSNYKRVDLDTTGLRLVSTTGNQFILDDTNNYARTYITGTEHLRVTTGGLRTYSSIEVGALAAGTGNREAVIDLVSDETYTDFSARFSRDSGGPNGGTYLQHRGTGTLNIYVQDAGTLSLLTNNTHRFWLAADGKIGVGMGAATGASTLMIVRGATSDSTQNAFALQNSSATVLMFVRNDGADNRISSNWALISDRQAKNTIQDLDKKTALSRVMKWRPREYYMNHIPSDKKFFGFVAQELETDEPDLIAPRDENGYLGVRQGDMLPILVAAVQELTQQLEELKAKN